MIFEKRGFSDGGPNDKGFIMGYEKGENQDEVRARLNVTTGFIQFFRITEGEYESRKQNSLALHQKLFKF